MAQVNLEKLSLKELQELESRLGPAIRDARMRETKEARGKLDEIARKMGFSVQELYGSKGRRGSVEAKYINPENASETWTGRGRMPVWLRNKVDKGAKKESFLIK